MCEQRCSLPAATKQRRVLKPANSVLQRLTSEPKSRRDSKISERFAADKENDSLVGVSKQVAVDDTIRTNASAADTKNRTLIKVFDKVSTNRAVTVNSGIKSDLCCEPVKTSHKQVSVKQTVADSTFAAVQQSTKCSKTVSASSCSVEELNVNVEAEGDLLAGGHSAQELHQLHSKLFHRR